jgi:hypothetical protein
VTSDAVEGSFTCAGITLEDAEAHAYIYASAVADLYGADSTSVIVTFAAGRRRLQSSDDVEVGYHVLYPSAAEAAAAAAAGASLTAADFDGAVQSAAADAGVADVFAAASVEDVGTPAAATAGLDCYYLDWAGDGYCDEQNNVEACVEINQCVECTRQFFTKSFLGDDAAFLARSSGEEPASPRHREGVASMAWGSTRRFSTTAP